MYRDGSSLKAIAEKTGLPLGIIRGVFKRATLQLRSLSEAGRLSYEMGRHPRWKGGVWRRQYKYTVKREACGLCQGRLNLVVHHQNFDHYDNQPQNVQVLCVSCHKSLHSRMYWEAKKKGEIPLKSNCPVGWRKRCMKHVHRVITGG